MTKVVPFHEGFKLTHYLTLKSSQNALRPAAPLWLNAGGLR
jgi:hypothetical protein